MLKNSICHLCLFLYHASFFQCFLYTSIHIKLWERNFVTRGNIKTSERQVSCLRHLTQEKLDSDLANHKIGRWIVRKEKELNVLSGETWKVRAVVLAVYSLRIFSLFKEIILDSFFFLFYPETFGYFS